MGLNLNASFDSQNIRANKLGWILSLLAFVIFSAVAYFVIASVKTASKENIKNQLETILTADVEALKIWLSAQEKTATVIAGRDLVSNLVENLNKIGTETSYNPKKLEAAPAHQELQNFLAPLYTQSGYVGFLVTNMEGWHIASSGIIAPGNKVNFDKNQYLERILKGDTVLENPLFLQKKLTGSFCH
jgi:eukaryotic-like serine/threonine-protein kinase